MLARRLIPCLDVKAGRVVKGIGFVGLRDAGDPVEQARRYDDEGADELTFLDVTASLEDRGAMLDVVARTADVLTIPLTVGGGVRGLEDARALLLAGADKIAINSAAVASPWLVAEIADVYGNQALVLAVDAKRVEQSAKIPSGYEVFVRGGRQATGRDAIAWCREAVGRGAGEILLTSIDRDGSREGYDISLVRAVVDAVEVPVVASGGAGALDHLLEALVDGGADAVLAASIFHEAGQGDGKGHTIGEAKAYLAEHGVVVRT